MMPSIAATLTGTKIDNRLYTLNANPYNQHPAEAKGKFVSLDKHQKRPEHKTWARRLTPACVPLYLLHAVADASNLETQNGGWQWHRRPLSRVP